MKVILHGNVKKIDFCRCVFFVVILAALFSCVGCRSKGVITYKHLAGKNVNQIPLDQWEKQYDTLFWIKSDYHPYEYQNPIVGLSSSLQKNDSLQVREMMFRDNRSGDSLVLWGQRIDGEWIVFDAVRFPKEVRF